MVRAVRTRAILLRSVDYGEADRILTLLTPAAGLVSAIARSARSSRRRFGGALEPFSVIDVELAAGRGELSRLQQARIGRAFAGILSDLQRMRAAGDALDVVRQLSAPEAEGEAIFDATLAMLEIVDGADGPLLSRLGAGYRARLLSLAGFAPDLQRCGSCGRAPGAEQPAMFDPGAGHLVCRGCGGARCRLSARSRALLAALGGMHWTDAVAAEWPQIEAEQVGGAVAAMIAERIARPRM